METSKPFLFKFKKAFPVMKKYTAFSLNYNLYMILPSKHILLHNFVL
jgi:hypothetical protein